MKEEVKAKWIEALRSGRYTQGRGNLRRIDRGEPQFCCLGVLCDISNQGEWAGMTYVTENGSSSQILPQAVIDWAGLSASNPFLLIEKISLAELNDTGEPFEQIAERIKDL